MNSTQLHYREATRHLEDAKHRSDRQLRTDDIGIAQTHALLGVIAALEELTRQASPDTLEAVATATGVLTDNVIHHAFNAFGSDR
ncbi:hypothetical protein ABH931_006117 [Streptacidiphilus sp. MAP12-33]|uniref:hypothetical protein n=1 Tax=Streptacidiphilus sp. MAP12-33 TaxID=3156266 RepID=UPI0035110314